MEETDISPASLHLYRVCIRGRDMKFPAAWNFVVPVITGTIVMYLLGSLPIIIGPLVGGFVAGLITRRDAKTGTVAGFLAAALWVILVFFLLVLGVSSPGNGFLPSFQGLLHQPVLFILLIPNALFFGLAGAAGGIVGGILGEKWNRG
jgi:hypothetical protein